jgi:hypothetical protein
VLVRKDRDLAKLLALTRVFFISNSFLGGGGGREVFPKVEITFFNQHRIQDFKIPNITYFEKTNFYLSEGLFFKIFEYKRQFMEKLLTQNCNAHCSFEFFFFLNHCMFLNNPSTWKHKA